MQLVTTTAINSFQETNPPNNDAIQRSNAKRLFLNTLFVPANISFACAGNDLCICPDDSVTLGCDNINLDQNYVWTPSSGLSCTNCPRPKASPSSTTTYTMNQANGNCATSTITVSVLESVDTTNYEVICDLSSDFYTVSFDIIGGNSSGFTIDGLTGTLNGSNFISDPIINNSAYAFEISNELNCGKMIGGIHECLCSATAAISGGGDICNDGTTTKNIQFALEGNAPWIITYAIDGIAQPTISTMNNNYIHSSNIQGTYTLLSINDSDCFGVIDNTATVIINLNDGYEEIIETEMCEGEFYDFDGNNVLAGETQSFSYTTQQGCDSIITVQVNERLESSASLDTFLCEGQSLDINGITMLPGDQKSFVFSNNQACDSIYYVTIKAIDFEIDLGDDVEIFIKETVQLNAISQNNIETYEWSPAVSLSCFDCPNPIAKPSINTTYQLLATDENGCIGIAQKVVNVKTINNIFMPTAFSPNSDGQNDFLLPIIIGDVSDYSLMIYDRWGEELFTSDDFQQKWDGTYKNTESELGVYLYHLEIAFADGSERVLNGNVTLIR